MWNYEINKVTVVCKKDEGSLNRVKIKSIVKTACHPFDWKQLQKYSAIVTSVFVLALVASFLGHSFHHTMRSLWWIEIMLIMSQASGGNSEEWNATYKNNISTNKGEDATILCEVKYPSGPSVQAYWKILGQKINISDEDKNAFIYHPNKSMVSKRFQSRTELIGDINKGNCSLKIKTINTEDTGRFYLRISNGNNNWSFSNQLVSIHISGYNKTLLGQPTDTDNSTNTPPTTTSVAKTTAVIYIGIIIPLAAVVLLAALGNVWFFKYRKRSRLVTVQESVLPVYANFTPAPEIDKTTEKKGNTQVPPPRIINDPIYGNVEGPQNTMDSMDETDDVYANVDYADQ
ncbi:hypothetical protein UPYG_G00151820 [Umbra pygmaea]|uniref:Ig-like domain-containing protein n=1 Tax=Umbra pygmaea TaxID=75934 RepID=A0ABD0XFB7_UMBPY